MILLLLLLLPCQGGTMGLRLQAILLKVPNSLSILLANILF